MAFRTTHWSVVLQAGQGGNSQQREAVSSICAAYWYPLYAFVRRRGHSPHEAEDLTQEFFRRFLERDALARVQPNAGKFRSFLLACLKNFLSHERERANAQRRGGGQAPVPLETGDAEARYVHEPADHLTPEALYERQWAFAVLEQALADLRRLYQTPAKQALFEDLQGFLPGGKPGLSRAEIAARRGVTPGAIDVAVHRLRQEFRRAIQAVVAQTVSSEAEVAEELRNLVAIFQS